MLTDELPRLAAAAEALGEQAMAAGKDNYASDYFRVMELADELFLALVNFGSLEVQAL